MNFGILGTGTVGQTIGGKLALRGHAVKIGGRSSSGEAAVAWATKAGPLASCGHFRDVAEFGEIVFLCVKGEVAENVLANIDPEALAGKILIDVTNPLDFSHGFPPTLLIEGRDSLGERVQARFPKTKVVKALSTVSAPVMVEPALLGEPSELILCGNDAEAKARVTSLLRENFGWESFVDLGGIEGARGMEGYLLLWTRLYGSVGTHLFNLRIVKKA